MTVCISYNLKLSLTVLMPHYTDFFRAHVCLILTVQGYWWQRHWAPGSPPAVHIQCWHHSQYHSLKANSLLWQEQHSHVISYASAVFNQTGLDKACVSTYWLEVWGTHLWSVVSTSAHQHHCWEGRTSLGSSGQPLIQLWTTSCPHWDVSEKTDRQLLVEL